MYKCEENAMCDVGNVSFIKNKTKKKQRKRKKKKKEYYKVQVFLNAMKFSINDVLFIYIIFTSFALRSFSERHKS